MRGANTDRATTARPIRPLGWTQRAHEQGLGDIIVHFPFGVAAESLLLRQWWPDPPRGFSTIAIVLLRVPLGYCALEQLIDFAVAIDRCPPRNVREEANAASPRAPVSWRPEPMFQTRPAAALDPV